MIHLIVGPDYHLAATELRRVVTSADPEGLNTTRFDKSAGLGEIESAVSTMGFFGPGRVIVADGVMARASGAVKNKKAETEDIARLFAAIAPGNTLVLIDAELASVPKAIETAAGKDSVAFKGSVDRGSALVAWTARRVQELEGSIGQKEIVHLLHRRFPGDWQEPNRNPAYDNPPDLQMLNSELEKLVTASIGRTITTDDIDALISTETQDRLFPLLDAVLQGNAREALRMLSENGADDESSSRVLGQLVANAELGQIAVNYSGEAELAAVGKQIGQTNPKRLAAIKRNLTAAGASSLGAELLESDRRLKSGKVRSPSAQLHEVIVRRASRTRDR